VTNSLRAAFDEIRMAYNNDNESINGVLNNSETCEQFWQWAEYMVAKRFEHDNIPMSLEEQMPEEIRMLANMRNMIWSMDQ
jgi:2-keto-4-pentenoate hydratase/2-oxohepta-3-ene-1,7-dioic acid hydratase in catechol pathway